MCIIERSIFFVCFVYPYSICVKWNCATNNLKLSVCNGPTLHGIWRLVTKDRLLIQNLDFCIP